MESQKTLNSQTNSEKEKENWRHHDSRFQTVLQSYGDQDNMALAQKQTLRSMERIENPKNGPTTIWSTNLLQSRKISNRIKIVSSTKCLGKLNSNT